MIKSQGPRELAIDLLPRSICLVQVAAVLTDAYGIFAWGWNSVGSGFGEHAEAAAIRRANKARLAGAYIYVASKRRGRSKAVMSAPCLGCANLIKRWNLARVFYLNGEGEWDDKVV